MPSDHRDDYIRYQKLRTGLGYGTITGRFVPFMSLVDGEDRALQRGLRIDTTNLLIPAYGSSIYFSSPVTPSIGGLAKAWVVISCKCTFRKFDGIAIATKKLKALQDAGY